MTRGTLTWGHRDPVLPDARAGFAEKCLLGQPVEAGEGDLSHRRAAVGEAEDSGHELPHRIYTPGRLSAADAAFLSENKTNLIRHEINAHFIHYLGGIYKVQTEAEEGPTISFIIPCRDGCGRCHHRASMRRRLLRL